MLRETLRRLRGLNDLRVDTFDWAVVKVQQVHYAYGRRAYACIEIFPFVGEPARGIEQAQKGISDIVYHTIRQVNRLSGEIVSWPLEKLEERF